MNERQKTNNRRIDERDWYLPAVDELIKAFSKSEIIQKCEIAEIPVAPISRPEDLFDDPQLNQGGSLFNTIIQGGIQTKLPKIPLEMEDAEFSLLYNPPEIGEDTVEILKEFGYLEGEIEKFVLEKIIT